MVSEVTESETFPEAPMASAILELPQRPARLTTAQGQESLSRNSCDQTGLLATPSFIGLLVTQFLGALNDNMFRWLIVPIAKYRVGDEMHAWAMSAGLACFVLPYIVLAAPAGYLADRFSKRRVMVWLKVTEVAVMALGIFAIWVGNVWFMFATVFLMGAQSALFGPSKYGSLPELVRPDRLSAANGLIGLTTIIAVIAGSMAGFALYDLTGPDGTRNLWISAAALLGVATLGWLASLNIACLLPAAENRAFPKNPVGQMWRDVKQLGSHQALLRAALGSAFFWSLASLAQMNLDGYGLEELHLEQSQIGTLLATLALGVGLGNVLAAKLSGGKIELGLVPLGAIGITLAAGGMYFTTDSYAGTCFMLVALGTSAGLFDVPLQAFLQDRSPSASRGGILAAANLLTFCGTLGVSGLYAVLRGPMGLSAPLVYLLAAMATAVLVVYAVRTLVGPMVRLLVWMASRTFYRVRLEGLANFPVQGGALLAANHVSWLDGILLMLHSPRPIRMIAYADYVQTWWMRRLADDCGVIPIKPGDRRSVVDSIRTARQALQQGEIVCIFPEGGITRSGQTAPFKPGMLSMLAGTSAPLVPVHLGGLWGSVFSYSGGKFFWKLPRRLPYSVSIRFGEPIAQPESAQEVQIAVESLGV